MNNLEYLRTLDAGEMADAIIACKCCAYNVDKGCNRDNGTCQDGIEEWLLQEHEEPDSWEKLLEDLFVASDRGEIPGTGFTLGDYGRNIAAHLAARIRKLREADNER